LLPRRQECAGRRQRQSQPRMRSQAHRSEHEAGAQEEGYAEVVTEAELDGAKRTDTENANPSAATRAETKRRKRMVMAENRNETGSNEPLHVTAARWRFLPNLNGHGGSAARERER
jgi:hypothetical protein